MPINYKAYPHNWKTTIHRNIVERSKNKCEKCGVENGSIVISHQVKKWNGKKWVYRREWTSLTSTQVLINPKEVKVILTKAHTLHDAHNPRPGLNTILHLCQICHLRLDSYVKARRRACGKWCIYPNCTKMTCDEYSKR